MEASGQLKILVGAEDPQLAAAVQEVLLHMGLRCEPRQVVPLDQVVEQAGLDAPALVIVQQPQGSAAATELLRELSNVCRAHLICLGPADDPKRIMAVMQAGAHEYLDESLWSSMLTESLVRFKSRPNLSVEREHPSHVIGIMTAVGGAGGSTIAANVATSLAAKHGSALLMDLRLQSGDLASLLDLQPSFTLADLSQNLSRLDDSLFEQILCRHTSGVHLLAAPTDATAAEAVSIKGVRRAMTMGIRRFPYLVMDLGSSFSAVHQEAIMRADVLAVVLRLDYSSIRNARRILDQFDSLGIDRDKVRLIVNRYGEAKQLSLSQVQVALGREVALALPEEPATINWSINNGQMAVTAKPRAKVSRRLQELSSLLNGKLP